MKDTHIQEFIAKLPKLDGGKGTVAIGERIRLAFIREMNDANPLIITKWNEIKTNTVQNCKELTAFLTNGSASTWIRRQGLSADTYLRIIGFPKYEPKKEKNTDD